MTIRVRWSTSSIDDVDFRSLDPLFECASRDTLAICIIRITCISAGCQVNPREVSDQDQRFLRGRPCPYHVSKTIRRSLKFGDNVKLSCCRHICLCFSVAEFSLPHCALYSFPWQAVLQFLYVEGHAPLCETRRTTHFRGCSV